MIKGQPNRYESTHEIDRHSETYTIAYADGYKAGYEKGRTDGYQKGKEYGKRMAMIRYEQINPNYKVGV